jgi:hypothetical protein
VTDQSTASRGSSAGDVMSARQFEEELRRLARFHGPCLMENPLAAAVKTVTDNPAFVQSRLLGRIVIALAHNGGEFRRAEAAALDAATLGLVIVLMNIARDGTTARADWISAADACVAAAGSCQ